MTEKKRDRRVKRTRSLLNNALMQLVREKGYDNVTIEEITERANLGRTTFYLHYHSKDDLLLDHHNEFVSRMKLGILSRQQLLGQAPQSEMVDFLAQIRHSKVVYQAFTQARDATIIMRRVRERGAQNLLASLEQAFPNSTPTLPLDVLTRYIVDAQFSMIDWWLRTQTPYEPVEFATMLHQMRRALVRDAFEVS